MEVEKLENEKDTLERKLQELKDELAQVGRGQDRKDSDLAELQRKHQAEIDKLKQEIAALQDKHLSDLDDEKEQYTKMTKMRDELNKTSEKLIASETNRANLKNELDKIQTDLKFGRSIDTPGPRDPSLVEIPKAEDDASKEIHVPSELKYDDGQSSMTSSHYSTLGRDHGL
ncbi:unnamed protein product, partial [Mesorhabditis spiculigera]